MVQDTGRPDETLVRIVAQPRTRKGRSRQVSFDVAGLASCHLQQDRRGIKVAGDGTDETGRQVLSAIACAAS
jgi:hypothetical protein